MFKTPKVLPPKWTSPEDWKKNPSTKWKMVVELLKHILNARNDAEMPQQKPGTSPGEGEIEFPEIEGDGEGNANAKVVVYVEFVKHMPWFSTVSLASRGFSLTHHCKGS